MWEKKKNMTSLMSPHNFFSCFIVISFITSKLILQLIKIVFIHIHALKVLNCGCGCRCGHSCSYCDCGYISTYVMYFVFLFFGVCSLKLSMLQRNAAYCCPNAVWQYCVQFTWISIHFDCTVIQLPRCRNITWYNL